MKNNVLIVVLLVALILVSCGIKKNEPTDEVMNMTVVATEMPTTASAYQPPAYTQEEIQAAMDVAKAKFDADFTDCKLLRMEYIEGKYLSDYEYYGADYDTNRVIVLESDFYVGPGAHGSFNLDSTYHNWKWILIDTGEGWFLRTYGYG